MGNHDTFELRLVQRLAALREERGWPLEELAKASGISRATLSRLERGETSPTAQLLGKLCAVYGMPMSRLIAEVEVQPAQLIRAAEQNEWQDPGTGFVRRMVSPPAKGFGTELIEGRLPAGAVIDYPLPPVRGLEQHIWMLSGVLIYTLDGVEHRLQKGDCLRFHLFGPTRFHCPGPHGAHYLIAICEPLNELDANGLRAEADVLAEVLRDCVLNGASVGFVLPFPHEEARAFWLGLLPSLERRERRLFVMRDAEGRICGTAQLVLGGMPNGRHRAEIAKMLVHSRARRQGVAQELLLHAERCARAEGRTLIVLDTCTGYQAEPLYLKLGYQVCGTIPNFATMPDGALGATTVMYKQLT